MEIALADNQRKKVASDGFMGMIFVLTTEAMFFSGLISAYIVNRTGAKVWPPYGQPRLPIEITAFNTAVLLSSAVLLLSFRKKFAKAGSNTKGALALLNLGVMAGALFLAIQGTEWVKMLSYGLTQRSSIYGAFFYLIIGMHGLHVFAGLMILLYLRKVLNKAVSFEVKLNTITVCSMYWLFVVGIWPILYVLVYLL